MSTTLYKRGSSGKLQEWTIETVGGRYRTISGQVGGSLVYGEWTVCVGKNAGRSNETTPETQALAEVKAKIQEKIDKGYRHNVADLDTVTFRPPMLAKNYDDHAHKIKFPIHSQPKLDGMRCIVTKDGMVSRNGKPIVAAPHILEELKGFFELHPDVELDGELYAHAFKDDFNKIISLVKKTKPTPADLQESKEKVQYWIYDIRDSKYNFDHRFSFLRTRVFGMCRDEIGPDGFHVRNEWVPCQYSRYVHTIRCHDQQMLDIMFEIYLEKGFEGQMIRTDTVYEYARTTALLKRKTMPDEEFEIIDVIEGLGKRAGLAGAIRCKMKDGKEFQSSIIGDMAYCTKLLAEKDKVIGKLATVKYQNLTPDGIPRFPVMKSVRDYE